MDKSIMCLWVVIERLPDGNEIVLCTRRKRADARADAKFFRTNASIHGVNAHYIVRKFIEW